MPGPRAVSELLEVWLRGLPLHESGILRALALAIAQAKGCASELPPSIDRRCRELIATKLDEAEHWALAALRAAVDRADRERPPPRSELTALLAEDETLEERIERWDRERDCGDADELGLDGHRNKDRP